LLSLRKEKRKVEGGETGKKKEGFGSFNLPRAFSARTLNSFLERGKKGGEMFGTERKKRGRSRISRRLAPLLLYRRKKKGKRERSKLEGRNEGGGRNPGANSDHLGKVVPIVPGRRGKRGRGGRDVVKKIYQPSGRKATTREREKTIKVREAGEKEGEGLPRRSAYSQRLLLPSTLRG